MNLDKHLMCVVPVTEPTQVTHPYYVHPNGDTLDLGWYYFDEDDRPQGPIGTYEEAKAALWYYIEYLGGGE